MFIKRKSCLIGSCENNKRQCKLKPLLSFYKIQKEFIKSGRKYTDGKKLQYTTFLLIYGVSSIYFKEEILYKHTLLFWHLSFVDSFACMQAAFSSSINFLPLTFYLISIFVFYS